MTAPVQKRLYEEDGIEDDQVAVEAAHGNKLNMLRGVRQFTANSVSNLCINAEKALIEAATCHVIPEISRFFDIRKNIKKLIFMQIYFQQ